MLKDSYELLANSGALGVFLVALVGCGFVIRGLFVLRQSRGRDRREFLDLWSAKPQKEDDLWIELAVRHCFGVLLPASLIRRALRMRHPSRVLFDISGSWAYLDYSENDGTLTWRAGWRRDRWLSGLEYVGLFSLYVLLALIGLAWPLHWLRTGEFHASAWQISMSIVGVGFAVSALLKAMSLREAANVVESHGRLRDESRGIGKSKRIPT